MTSNLSFLLIQILTIAQLYNNIVMLHIINNFICYYDIKNNIHFMELFYSDMIYIIMFIEGASETERNRIQGHWRKLGGILVKSIHLEK